MVDPIAVSAPVSGTDTTLSFETGKLAFQSQGAVVTRLGKTEVLVTANGSRNLRDGIDFFPLTVTRRAMYPGPYPCTSRRRSPHRPRHPHGPAHDRRCAPASRRLRNETQVGVTGPSSTAKPRLQPSTVLRPR